MRTWSAPPTLSKQGGVSGQLGNKKLHTAGAMSAILLRAFALYLFVQAVKSQGTCV